MTIEELQAELEKTRQTTATLQEKLDRAEAKAAEAEKKRKDAEAARQAAEDEAKAKAEAEAEKSGNIDEVRQALEAKFTRELEKANKRAAEAEAALNSRVIDGGLTEALTKANVAPSLLRAAGLLFKDAKKIEVKDGQAFADGVPLADAVSEWANTDEGAGFKAAGQSNGGGAPGGAGSGQKPLAEMTSEERLELRRKDPERFRKLRAV